MASAAASVCGSLTAKTTDIDGTDLGGISRDQGRA
jgi:hypothetical protein